MKKFTLMLFAGLFVLAGSVIAQKKTVMTVEDVSIAEDGTCDIVINLTYPTTESVAGYNFSLRVPDGIQGINAKSGKVTGTGKVTAASVLLNSEVHPNVWDADEEDYVKDPKEALTVESKTDGSVLFIWIDQKKQTPLKSTEGGLMTIKTSATADFTSGEAKITGIGFTSASSVSLDLGNIDDVTFLIGSGSEQGINDIQSADASAPAYNLQGVRVNANAKGVIIRDGKKTIVK